MKNLALFAATQLAAVLTVCAFVWLYHNTVITESVWVKRAEVAGRFVHEFGLARFDGCIRGERLLECSGEKPDGSSGIHVEVAFGCDEYGCRSVW